LKKSSSACQKGIPRQNNPRGKKKKGQFRKTKKKKRDQELEKREGYTLKHEPATTGLSRVPQGSWSRIRSGPPNQKKTKNHRKDSADWPRGSREEKERKQNQRKRTAKRPTIPLKARKEKSRYGRPSGTYFNPSKRKKEVAPRSK